MAAIGAKVQRKRATVTKGKDSVELTQDQLAEFRECFTYFDTDQDGKISGAQFCNVIRSLGCNPTEKELKAMSRVVDNSYRGYLTFTNFIHLMCTLVLPNTKKSQEYNKFIKKAFATFENHIRGSDKGRVTTEDLKMLMMDYGDALSAPMMDELLRELSGVTNAYGELVYDDVVDKVVGKPPKWRSRAASAQKGRS